MRQAAQFQHWIAASIRADHPEQSLRDLAATAPGLSYVQLHRILTGSAHLSMRDLLILNDAFGPLISVVDRSTGRTNGSILTWPFPALGGGSGPAGRRP